MNKVLITGGAGFIGVNYAARQLGRGEALVIYDNLSRPGADNNIEWLRDRFGKNAFEFIKADVRDFASLQKGMQGADVIVHLAAQVAVTTSVTNPREDFEINALGTFNVLEAARKMPNPPLVIYASTNKVYGELENAVVVEEQDHYRYLDLPYGIPETQPLDFHSPYGCSKGSGDQYVRDYHRIYHIPTVVLRQSCIYGTRQFGIEDQGFLAWFVIAAVTGRPITIYGDGKQVRDILFIEDLMDLYDACIVNKQHVAGKIYNVGGGPDNTLAIWRQFEPILADLKGEHTDVDYSEWRPGDQLVYVSDIRKAQAELGWSPKIGVLKGIEMLYNWVNEHRSLFST